MVLSKFVSFRGCPSRFLIKCPQICYCFHFPVFSILRSDTELFLSYKMHMTIMLFFRNPVYWIVPVETGDLEKGTPMKLLGSLQHRLQLATQGHLITLILEDFWEAEADWWELLLCDTWEKILKPQGFTLVFPIWNAASRGSLNSYRYTFLDKQILLILKMEQKLEDGSVWEIQRIKIVRCISFTEFRNAFKVSSSVKVHLKRKKQRGWLESQTCYSPVDGKVHIASTCYFRYFQGGRVSWMVLALWVNTKFMGLETCFKKCNCEV